MNDCRTRCKISVVLSSTFVSILFQNWYKSLFQLPLQLFQLYQSVFDCVQTFVSFARQTSRGPAREGPCILLRRTAQDASIVASRDGT